MADESILSRINKLMALAMNEGATADERDLALQRAEALRRKHTVEEWELRQSGQKPTDDIKIEEFDVSLPLRYAEHINSLLNAVLHHCNIKYKWKNYYKTAEMVGYSSDVEFAKKLWFVVYAELAANLFPQWREDRPFEHNVYAFVKGGYKWRMIADAANAAGVEVKWPDNGRLKRAYHNWCKHLQEEPTAHTQRHEAFRNSYVQSYQSTVSRRLRDMARQSKDETSSDRDKFALAVVDSKERVQQEFYRLFPQYDPATMEKRYREQREAEDARRAAMTQKQRDDEDEKAERQYQRARKHYDKMRDKEYDPNGWQHGVKVGSNVDLSMNKNHVAPNRSEIDQ